MRHEHGTKAGCFFDPTSVSSFFAAALATLAIAIFPGLAVGQEEPSSVSPAPVQTSPEKPDKRKLVVSFKDGRLTVRAEDASLNALLEEISQRAMVGIIRDDGVGGRVSVTLEDVPLEQGLRQILNNYDAFFSYAAKTEGPAALQAVWVYPRGRGRYLEPVPPEQWASSKEIEGMLGDPDPAVRARAIQTLVERIGSQAKEQVLHALQDGDSQVRTLALYGALSAHVRLPASSVEGLAVRDASPTVRALALDALAGQPKLEELARQALHDPDQQVRNKAEEILNRLHAPAATRSSRQPHLATPQGPD